MPSSIAIEKSPIGCTTETPDPSAFSAWCAQHKVLWPKCRMGVSPTTGRCVLASEDIASGEVVVEVPDDVVLMAENCSIADVLEADGLTKPADNTLLEVQGLVLAVMYEAALGPASRWAPYLAFLPRDLSHMIVYWEESEVSELVGTAAHDKLVGRVQHPADAPTRVRQLFEELVVPFVLAHEGVAAVLLGGAAAAAAGGRKKAGAAGRSKKVTQEQLRQKLWQPYLWATSAVASYSFVLGDESYQGMVAVWDLLNHVTGGVNVRLHHDPDRGVLQMIATEAIPAGAEVVNCYGQLSNAELLRGYGYVEAGGHNSNRHAQLPAHFAIKAAAAAAAGGEGDRQAKQPPASAAVAAGDGSDAESGSDSEGGSEESGDESDEGGSEGDESSSEDESEPDWDLEDDEPEALQQQWQRQQQQQQQQQGEEQDRGTEQAPARKKQKRQHTNQQPQEQQQEGKRKRKGQQQGASPDAPTSPPPPAAAGRIPSLSEAQAAMPDWEERWQLCFSLGLLPKDGVFQVPAGGLGSCPGPLLGVLLLLLSAAEECAALAAASAAASEAAVAAAAAAGGGGGGGKGGKQKKHKGKGKAAAAAAAAVEEPAAVVERELSGIQFCAPSQLHAALAALVSLALSRYPTSLEQDTQLLQQRASLAPRLAAAVTARVGEKEVWGELQQALQAPGAAQQVMQQARAAVSQAVLAAAAEAAAAAEQKRQRKCCGVPGCEHDHAHGHGNSHEQQQQQQHSHKQQGKQQDDEEEKQQQQQGFSFNFDV